MKKLISILASVMLCGTVLFSVPQAVNAADRPTPTPTPTQTSAPLEPEETPNPNGGQISPKETEDKEDTH
jgi:hypothetical protein